MNEYERKQAERKARREERADKLEAESNRTFAEARKMGDAIPFGQPILVGHHSEKRDRNYRGRMNAKYEKSARLQEQADAARAKAAATGTGGISSDDPDAVKKLRDKLAKLETLQATMRDANAAIRKHKTAPEQIAALVALGIPEKAAPELIKPDFAGRIGFAAYQLSNNNAEIRRLKARIDELGRASERTDFTSEHEGFTYHEDTEENRVMFRFAKKPTKALCAVMRQHGFTFSPTRDNAWVRKITGNALWAGRQLREKVEKFLTSGDSDAPN